ncbi:helix-turn-helix domain-containing protein [Poriferisphaera corsica]|nr:hypothetical protein [Poriferisphaera corsica]
MSETQFRLLVQLFVEEHHAKEIARCVGVNRNSVNRVLHKLRLRIAEACEVHADRVGVGRVMGGAMVVNVSGEVLGVKSGVAVLEEPREVGIQGFDRMWVMVKRRACVVESDGVGRNMLSDWLIPFVVGRVEACVYTRVFELGDVFDEGGDLCGWFGEQGDDIRERLREIAESDVDGEWYDVYRRVYPAGGGVNGVGDAIYRLRDANSLESFWDRARARFARLRGVRDDSFYLCLKESEYRHNHRGEDLCEVILDMLGERPLS